MRQKRNRIRDERPTINLRGAVWMGKTNVRPSNSTYYNELKWSHRGVSVPFSVLPFTLITKQRINCFTSLVFENKKLLKRSKDWKSRKYHLLRKVRIRCNMNAVAVNSCYSCILYCENLTQTYTKKTTTKNQKSVNNASNFFAGIKIIA